MVELSALCAVSAIILFIFIAVGVIKFGLHGSYSAYSSLWGKEVPMNNMNLWSLITFIAALFIMPVLLELGSASMLQFLGFLVPIYLIVVSLTPEWQTNKAQNDVHMIFAVMCAIGAVLWQVLVLKMWWPLILGTVFVLSLALFTGTARRSAIFWLEIIMFISTYLAIFLAIF